MKLLTSACAFLPGIGGLVLLGLGAGCSEIDFAEQDVALRYLDTADEIELSVETRGIFATPAEWGDSAADVLARGKQRVEGMAAGGRYFYLVAFPFIFDLDQEWEEEGDEWLTNEQSGGVWKLFQDSVSVTSARAFLDEVGEVALTQQVAIKNAAACVAAVNEIVTAGVQHELKEAADKPEDPSQVYGSYLSRKNLRAFADAGGEWVSLSEEALVVRIPMTSHDLALFMKAMLADLPSGGDPSTPSGWSDRRDGVAAQAIFGRLEGLEVKDGVVALRFPVDEAGRIQWEFRMLRHPDAKKLVAAFDAEELK